ncbi:MAG: undecaprenyl-diphosphate phosphatase [Nitrospirales bacterium]|nr:undecaprenyl-diphosphate phosphatase [Nitrospirales bacterium]
MGIVQGITEFFPVSSTAHLILFPWFFGWEGEINSLTFDVALHGGTLMALLVFFYKDWLNLLLRDRRMLLFLILATIPAGVVGVLLNDFVENTLRSPLIIVFTLIGVGILMLVAEKYAAHKRGKTIESISLSDALFIGVAQAVALIPGVSRSGATITAGLFRHVTRESAARFSFLLSAPVIGGAFLLEGRKILDSSEANGMGLFALGFIVSFVSGLLAIKFLLSFLKKYPLNAFVYYRFLLAGVIAVFYLKG